MSYGSVSTCEKNAEKWERFYSVIGKKYMVQYDYRDDAGKLFSCVRPTVEECRAAKDIWLTREQ